MCYVDEIIKNNDLGYNMVIEENGFNISGGEKQRIVLARALLKNSDVILIDEGLSQVDIELERMILKNIFTYYKDKTFIFVSHRDNNHDLFSKIIKLEDGVLLNG
jgi:ABC-type bacteriocin/lantibiotic exporter with double-glycine peptidase domain